MDSINRKNNNAKISSPSHQSDKVSSPPHLKTAATNSLTRQEKLYEYWQKLPVALQLANIGSEVSQAIHSYTTSNETSQAVHSHTPSDETSQATHGSSSNPKSPKASQSPKDNKYFCAAYARALELFDLTIRSETSRHHTPGIREITLARDVFCDYFNQNLYHTDPEKMLAYYNQFAPLAHKT